MSERKTTTRSRTRKTKPKTPEVSNPVPETTDVVDESTTDYVIPKDTVVTEDSNNIVDEEKDKFKEFSEHSNTNVRVVSSMLTYYSDNMGVKNKLSFSKGVRYQRELLNALVSNIKATTDEKSFKEVFDVINYHYLNSANDAFKPNMLTRFMEHWNDGVNHLNTLNILNHVISALCDPKTRANNLKKMDLNKAFSRPTILEPKYINYIKQYYKS